MMIRFSSILLIIFLFGCNDSNRTIEDKELKSKLLQSYIDKANDRQNSKEDRKKNLEKAYSIYSTLNNDTYKVNKIHEISVGYYTLKDFDKFRDLNEKALKLANEIKDSLNTAKSYAHLGMYYRPFRLDIAYKNFYEAEKIYASLDKTKYNTKEVAFEHGKVLVDLSQILRKTKDYSKSESNTIKAIKKFEKAENDIYIPMCYTNLGNLAKSLEHYDKAVEYQKKAIEHAKGTKKEVLQILISLNNIGTVYKSQQKYDKAKESYNEALSYTEFLSKNPKRHSLLLDNLAYVNFLSSDTTDIPDLFYESLKIRDSINDKFGIATNTLHLAEYYKSIGEDSIAKNYASRSLNISKDLQKKDELLKVYQVLADVSNSEEGLGYAREYIKLNDSLVKEERAFRDKFARIRFETDEIVEENLKMSKENEILIIAILGLTALFLLGYIIFRQQQSNKELMFAQTQQEANQEIYRLLLNQQIKLEEGRQLEQQRMSEELHDGVLGRLFGVRLSLDGINQRANDGFTEARNKYIEELKSIEKEIRLISHDLGTEAIPTDVAYIDAVESLISDLCEANDINFEFKNDENIDWEFIDDQKKVNLFRIVQESLQNIFKHAQAKSIKINFDYLEDKINLTILDDGIGFKSTKVKKGIGLKNITSRVSQMSGVVQFLSNNDTGATGTKVAVSVPV